MRIALIGATGFIGADLLNEAVERGHEVTAISRNPQKDGQKATVKAVVLDVLATESLTEALRGHDVVIAAYNPGNKPGVRGSASILAAAEASGVPRLLVVGGAGSLLLADGRRNVDSELFNPEWRQSALGTAAVLDMLRSGAEIDWVMLSPARVIEPGAKRGGFRLGNDHLLIDAEGQSFITTGGLCRGHARRGRASGASPRALHAGLLEPEPGEIDGEHAGDDGGEDVAAGEIGQRRGGRGEPFGRTAIEHGGRHQRGQHGAGECGAARWRRSRLSAGVRR